MENNEFKKLCSNIYIKKNKNFDKVEFNSNEKILICGAETVGWEEIPPQQSVYHVKTILTNRGYHNHKIQLQDKNVYISPEKTTDIKDIKFNNFDDSRFGNISYHATIGDAMSSSNIEEVKSWTLRRLAAMGYPCAKVSLQGIPDEGLLEVNIQAGERIFIKDIKREELQGVYSSALSRFDAFRIDNEYNIDFLQLTSQRLNSSGITSYSFFQHNCQENSQTVYQKIILDSPYKLILALGASTEELPIFKLNWSHNKLNRRASTLNSQLYLSPLEQSWKNEMQLFFFNQYPRLYFFPNISLVRTKEDIYTSLLQRYQLGAGYNLDSQNAQYVLRTGPAYNIEKTIEGFSKETQQYLAIDTELSYTSHYYEYFQLSPRTGQKFIFVWKVKQENDGSKFNTNLFKLAGHVYSNLGKFDPPIFIFGLRFNMQTLSLKNLNEPPPSYRLYLGGNDDIRGFARKSINNSNLGYITTAYAGLETRLVSILPYELQPFLFYDIAKVGLETLGTAKPLFHSPGVGLRWESFIGTFRGTAARGYIKNKAPEITQNTKEEWNFYLSYGKEF